MERYARLLDTKTHRNGLRKPTKHVTEAEKLIIDLFFEKKLNCIESCDTYTRFSVKVNQEKYIITHSHCYGITNELIINVPAHFGATRPLIVIGGRLLAGR
jgi:hypothetical protein